MSLPAQPITIKTIRDLRVFLARIESDWSEEDEKFLGKFDDQEVRVPYFEQVPSSSRKEFMGYGIAALHYDGGLGFIVQQPIKK